MRKLDLRTHGRSRTLFGKRLQQSWPSLFVMEKILARENPDLIVELGGGTGVLAAYFVAYALLADRPVKTLTVDLDVKPEARKMINLHQAASFIQGDIKSNVVVAQVLERVDAAERPLVLVDGADPKSEDANLYAELGLKSGTITLVHDVLLGSDKGRRWMCGEGDIDFTLYERFEPYHSTAREWNARLLCLKRL